MNASGQVMQRPQWVPRPQLPRATRRGVIAGDRVSKKNPPLRSSEAPKNSRCQTQPKKGPQSFTRVRQGRAPDVVLNLHPPYLAQVPAPCRRSRGRPGGIAVRPAAAGQTSTSATARHSPTHAPTLRRQVPPSGGPAQSRAFRDRGSFSSLVHRREALIRQQWRVRAQTRAP